MIHVCQDKAHRNYESILNKTFVHIYINTHTHINNLKLLNDIVNLNYNHDLEKNKSFSIAQFLKKNA